MNPFIKSTVARPVPQNHNDYQWPENQANEDLDPDSPVTAMHSGIRRRNGVSPVDKNDSSRQSGITTRARCLTTSVVAALGLCFSLTLSAISGVTSSPAFIVGVATFAGAFVPRAAHAVDVNLATAQELQAVRGIGPKMALSIIEERTRGGAYASLSDLSDRVKGIGSKKATALQAAGLTLAAGPVSGKTDRSVAAPVSGVPSKTGRR